MKNITLCAFILLCLGSMPLGALKGKDDDTPENSKPVAAAANPSASQARPKPKAAPHKVVSRPEPFVLDAEACKTLQSTAPGDAGAKEALLEKAACDFTLQIIGPLTLPTELMASFVNVRSFYMCAMSETNLPLLPCPEKLESLTLHHITF